jgi:hypothetical protein
MKVAVCDIIDPKHMKSGKAQERILKFLGRLTIEFETSFYDIQV